VKVNFRTNREVREQFTKTVEFLGLPRIALYVREESLDKEGTNTGIFSLNKNGKPYIVLWREGWNSEIIQHELMHYVQYLVDEDSIFKTDGDEDDLFEKEAEVAGNMSLWDLKKYVTFRLEYKDFLSMEG
jgi:hypothetical protein